CYVTGSFSYSANFDTLMLTNTDSLGLGSDAFLAKYSPAGDVVWATQVSGPGDCQGRRIALDAAGNCWLGGNFFGTADFGNGLILSDPVPTLALINMIFSWRNTTRTAKCNGPVRLAEQRTKSVME